MEEDRNGDEERLGREARRAETVGPIGDPRQKFPVPPIALRLVLLALFASGIASIINQVIWQRALKTFLGGSEAISSMVVVFVFMLGLGIGSAIVGRRARQLASPLRALGRVELGLFALNSLIAVLLSLDLAESIFAAQRVAVAAMVPLRVVYAVGALVLLLPPTVLMGATLPLAAEACQRQLGATESRLITVLLALNTVGAGVGALGSSFLLLPYFGQRVSLLVAAACNLLAGSIVLVLTLAVRASPAATVSTSGTTDAGRRRISRDEATGFALGFLSLGYEMYLLRVVALAHEPRPYTFAFTLFFFLLFWTFGVWLAGRMRDRSLVVLALALVLGVVLVACMPAFYAADRWSIHVELFRGGLVYFLPCVCFGAMYGTLVSRVALEWGRDVGRFYALNTIGSCLGILFFTLVGYEIQQDLAAALIALGLVAVLLEFVRSARDRRFAAMSSNALRGLQVVLGLAGIAIVVYGLASPFSETWDRRTYWGRDGVIEVRHDGSGWIDGLWHSEFSNGASHVGDLYSWMMVVAAVLAHRDEPMSDALVVGNGLGLTATTLTKLEGMQVDAYEINRTFAEVLEDCPEETLYSGTHPRIRIRWQDGRSGLALDPKPYDLVISAPLHLRAAGSANLLSIEYFELVRSRLKQDGVLCVYSREDRPEQGELIRATVRSVFPYVETFRNGVLTVASQTPIEISETSIRERMKKGDPLYREMAAYDRALYRRGNGRLGDWFDAKRLPIHDLRYRVTDDHPLIEYLDVTARLLGESPTRSSTETEVSRAIPAR